MSDRYKRAQPIVGDPGLVALSSIRKQPEKAMKIKLVCSSTHLSVDQSLSLGFFLV